MKHNEVQRKQTTACPCITLFVSIICIAPLFLLACWAKGQSSSSSARNWLYTLSRSTNIFSKQNAQNFPDDLEIILAKTSMPNKTLIITTLNAAWAEENGMLDVFLESFRIGEGTQSLLENLLIVALDQKAFNRCKAIHSRCYELRTEGVDFSAEKVFMTEDYIKMMWRRILFLQDVLKLGYSFVFSDADILWFRNPFEKFSEEADFEIACDKYNGNPKDLSNEVNGGFSFIRSNTRAMDFYQFWYDSRISYPGKHDQDVLNAIKRTKAFSELGLKMMFLDTKYFSGFCQQRATVEVVCTMHANCCKGLKAKLNDLRLTLDDWKLSWGLGTNASSRMESSKQGKQVHTNWRAPNACLTSWAH
eukprot:Gb_18388 [translate_table: standard]